MTINDYGIKLLIRRQLNLKLKKFIDALPIPPTIKPTGIRDGIPYYEVLMEQIKQKLHRALPPTTVWGYNGLYPGPTFDVLRDHPILVKWENKLPFTHLLPVVTVLNLVNHLSER